MDRRDDAEELFGQDVLDCYPRARDPVQADVNTGYQISAATNLNGPTTMSETR